MPKSQNGALPRQLRTLFHVGTMVGLTDGQLAERFATGRDEVAELAFAALVERHGALVLRVCRSILRDEHDAQDAFQATFLVLVRKARSLWVSDSLGPWLHQVAYRAACCARSARLRRRTHEWRASELASSRAVSEVDREDFGEALHEEIERLPERYRVPVVLCDLEGFTHEQVARHLGCPVGTVKSRLTRGRERLGVCLRRRDLSPSLRASVLPIAFGRSIIPPMGLIEATQAAAMRAAVGGLSAGAVPAFVLSLASGALWMMRLNTLKQWATASSAVALTGSGISAAVMLAGPDSAPPSRPPAAAAPPGASARPEVAVPARAGEPLISYEVTFLETPGISFRKIGIDPDFDLDPSGGLAFLSDLEVALLTQHLVSDPGASIMRAPEVSTKPREQAVIVDPGDHGRPISFIEHRPPGDPDVPVHRSRDLRPALPAVLGPPKAARSAFEAI